jgi:hypothetical protein
VATNRILANEPGRVAVALSLAEIAEKRPLTDYEMEVLAGIIGPETLVTLLKMSIVRQAQERRASCT